MPLLVAVNCPLTCFLPRSPVLQLPWNDFLDQSYMVTHIVFTSNNWYMAMSLHAPTVAQCALTALFLLQG